MKYFPKDKKALMMAALGRIPADLAITNANLVNVFTGEVYKANVFVYDGFIAHVETEDFETVNAKEVIDAQGQYLTPGLIDPHVHIESSMMIPRNFAKAVIPHGTTMVITDPHEIANVYGIRAVEYMNAQTEGLPMKMYIDIPSCVPAVPGLENAGATFIAEDIRKMLALSNIIGLAEVMDFIGVANADDRMMDILKVFEDDGRYIQGHAPGLTGRMLSSYRIGGPTTCHETRSDWEVKPKMRSGMYVDARSSSIAKNIPEIIKGLDGVKFYDRLTFCTDDREVDEIIADGHMNDVLRDAVKCGFDPITAIKSATINAAEAAKFENYGAIAPGYVADMLLMPSLEEIKPSYVFTDGKVVAKDGVLLADIPTIHFDLEEENSVNAPDFTVEDFKLKYENGDKATLNVMEYLDYNGSSSVCTQITLPVKDSIVDISGDESLHYAIVINRYGNGTYTKGIVKNFGEINAAWGTTVSHDSHNISIVYKNAEDAMAVYECLKKTGGGQALAENGKVLANVVLNVGGLMSNKPNDELAVEVQNMKKALNAAGLKLKNPMLRIVTLALPVIPKVKFSDMGLVDVLQQKFIPIFVEE
ncbi:MAG: adenine deaminase [Oscillospiraceae bacterium]|nr:adenine deaminase [Oscillospiraceae bacterium]